MQLTWEDRACPRCGKNFEGLDFWPDNATCSRCSRLEHAEHLANLNEGRAFRVDSIGGACPTQSEGVTAGGRPFYFRARHGDWVLRVGPAGDPVDYGKWADDGTVLAEGDDPTNGWMEDAAVLDILDRYCA